MIVKELLVKLGILVDAGEFQAAEHRLSRLSKATLALAGAASAVAAAKLGFEMAREAAQFEDALRIFEKAGHNLDKFRERSKDTLSTFDLVTQMNFAESFQISEDAFLKFIDIADAGSKKLGKDQDFVLMSLIKGAARMEQRWTDNASLVVDKKKVFAAYAKDLGLGSSRDLTPNQMREAYVADLLKQGDKMIEEVTKAGAQKGAGATDFYDSWKKAVSGIRIAIGTVAGSVFENLGKPVLDFINKNEKRYFALAKTLAGYVVPAAKLATAALTVLAVRGLGVAAIAAASAAKNVLWSTAAFVVNAAWSLLASRGLTAFSLSAARASGATWSLSAALHSFMASPIAIGAVVVLIGLLLEELYANSSEKVGLFEQLSGKWGQITDLFWQAGKNPNNHPLLNAILKITAAATEAVDAIDELFRTLARVSDAVFNNGSIIESVMLGAFDPESVKAMEAARADQRFTASTAPMTLPLKGSTGTSVPYDRAGRAVGSGRGISATDRLQVDVSINANGASAADKQLANAVADEVKAITQDQVTRARAATLPGSRSTASGTSSAPRVVRRGSTPAGI